MSRVKVLAYPDAAMRKIPMTDNEVSLERIAALETSQ
jgi:hypothetical protein